MAKRKADLLKMLAKHYFVVTRACHDAGIERPTFYNWYRLDPDFKAKVDRVEEDLMQVVEDQLKVEALNKQPWAIRYFLSRRHPKYKAKVEMTTGPEFDFSDETELE